MDKIGSLIKNWPEFVLKLLTDSDKDIIPERGQICAAIQILNVSVMSNEKNLKAFKNWKQSEFTDTEPISVEEFLVFTLTTQMSLEVRRSTMLFLQLTITKRDGQKGTTNAEWLLEILLAHIRENGCRMDKLSEEFYELIGDCCLQIYEAEK